jgi:hypothetical protein
VNLLGREELVGGWRRLCNKEIHKLYPLLNIIRKIRSRMLRLVEHIPSMGDNKCVQIFTDKHEGKTTQKT